MSTAANTTTKDNTEPAAAAGISSTTQNPSVNAADSTEDVSKPTAVAKTGLAAEHVAVLALGNAGEILAAGDPCLTMFGWSPGALVGRNIRILLKDGLDNDFGRFLCRDHAGQKPTTTSDLRMVALRQDGSEFPAQVTTQACSCDTTATKKGDTSLPRWTAAFRELGMEAKPVLPAVREVRAAGEVTSSKPQEPLPKEAAARRPVALLPERVQKRKEHTDGLSAAIAALQLKQRMAELEGQLNKANAELADTKAENEKLACHESDLRVQLDAAKEAASYTQAALREETASREKLDERLRNLSSQLSLEQAERRQRFEEELVALRHERDELTKLLATEEQGADESTRRAHELETFLSKNAAECERVKGELERQTAEHQKSESSLRQQLGTAWVAKKEVEGAWAEAVERNVRFEEELATLRGEHDELSRKLTAEQKAAADSKQRAKELESRLSRNAADSDQAGAELEKQIANREHADAEWRKQLEAAQARSTRLERSLTETMERTRGLQEELVARSQKCDELEKQLTSEQQRAVEAGQRAEEIQHRVDQSTMEIERLAADLTEQSKEREQAEARAREQQEIAQTLVRELEAERAGAEERNTRFEEELAQLRSERDGLAGQLKAEQQTSTDAAHHVRELQRHLEQITTELNRVRLEVKRKPVERGIADAKWPEELEPTKKVPRKPDAARAAATERPIPKLDKSIPPGPGQLPEYTFGNGANTPARRKGRLSKQRLEA